MRVELTPVPAAQHSRGGCSIDQVPADMQLDYFRMSQFRMRLPGATLHTYLDMHAPEDGLWEGVGTAELMGTCLDFF